MSAEDEYTEEVDAEEEETHEDEAAEDQSGYSAGQFSASAEEVQDKTFAELALPNDVVQEVQGAWQAFIASSGSREAAGEAIYSALFESATSFQSLFKTPRSVAAMRFMNGFNTIISSTGNAAALKTNVETLGFQLLDLEVTVPRVVIFRNAILDLLGSELGERLTTKARIGLSTVLNYVGGAYIYIRRAYAGRIRIIYRSWRTANKRTDNEGELDPDADAGADGEKAGEGEEGAGEDAEEKAKEANKQAMDATNAKASGESQWSGSQASGSGEARDKKSKAAKVPTTFNDMFLFNAAVMGFGGSSWMNCILDQFENIVSNAANSYRLQEECDVLSLVLAKYKGTINLTEFKAVMLASLRSLVPKDWDSDHEVAWGWLWENMERMLKDLMGKPAVMEKAIGRLIMSLTEDAVNYLRREVYKRFFALAPAGQDYFKQSTTRLYWIADKVVEITVEMYREPRRMVEHISALGLRHVGYGTPTELFAPYVSGAVEVVRTLTTDEQAEEAFRWSMTLVSKILVRTILEGSTLVMKAINTNTAVSLRKAVAIAPRAKRATELLSITVGTQSISPLYWSIESGSLNCAQAILEDLLVIRADRETYYYGCTELFTRHPDVIQRLFADASNLIPTLLDGLLWRSHVAVQGHRRVNYYVKHLIEDLEGKFNPALEWLVDGQDPKIMCHPVVVLFSDLLWGRLASRYFFVGKCYFLFTLLVFITSQSIIPHLNAGDNKSDGERIAIFIGRMFIYIGSMGRLFVNQMRHLLHDLKALEYVKVRGVPCPAYLANPANIASLALLVCLVIMCTQEPIFWCIDQMYGDFPGAGIFTQTCKEGTSHKEAYSVISMIAMLFYWSLVIDFSIFSMCISAFILVCSRVLSELGLFIAGLSYLVITFSCSISVLNHAEKAFAGIPKGALSLLEIGLGMFPTEHFESIQTEGVVLACVSVFVIAILFLLNLLVAQLNTAYAQIFEDMVGYARLYRGKAIVSTLANISNSRWERFLASLKLDERLEFGEGDVGIAGGIQVTEPAYLHPTTVDTVCRFGGSTAPMMPWPEDATEGDENSKFERLEKLVKKMASTSGKKAKGSKAGSSSFGTTSSSGGGSDVGSDE